MSLYRVDEVIAELDDAIAQMRALLVEVRRALKVLRWREDDPRLANATPMQVIRFVGCLQTARAAGLELATSVRLETRRRGRSAQGK